MAWVVAGLSGLTGSWSAFGRRFDVTGRIDEDVRHARYERFPRAFTQRKGPFESVEQGTNVPGGVLGRSALDKSTNTSASDGRLPWEPARPLASHPAHGRRKGEIQIAVAASPCVEFVPNSIELHRHRRHRLLRWSVRQRHARSQPEYGNIPRYGTETWTGTLKGSGLEFDVTRPTLTGATNKKVKAKKGAKSARVAFRVTAQDDRTAPCRSHAPRAPGSPSQSAEPGDLHRERFSANAAKASFTVTVQRRR